MAKLRIAVIGAGYWGPNLARNFSSGAEWELAAVCDIDKDRAQALVDRVGRPDVYSDLGELLARDDLDAVAVATPARTHHAVVLAALRAGKHVLVEKPLADSRDLAGEMVREAALRGLTLMTDHTYCYTAAVIRIREIIETGALGDLLFLDSVRINLGLIQPDVNVFWDLAPHDLSIIDFVLPGGLRPRTVSAHGADPLGAGRACIGYLTVPLDNGAIAHVHVNWLSPTKRRPGNSEPIRSTSRSRTSGRAPRRYTDCLLRSAASSRPWKRSIPVTRSGSGWPRNRLAHTTDWPSASSTSAVSRESRNSGSVRMWTILARVDDADEEPPVFTDCASSASEDLVHRERVDFETEKRLPGAEPARVAPERRCHRCSASVRKLGERQA